MAHHYHDNREFHEKMSSELKSQQNTMASSSTITISSTSSVSEESQKRQRWYEDAHAKRALISSSSAFYVFILAIFALVYELSHLMKITEEHDPQIVRWMDLYVGIYMYGLGIAFLCFCYYELYDRHKQHPLRSRVNTVLRLESIQPSKSSTDDEFYDEKVPFHHEILTSDSWFLRLGCVVFGVIGLAYYTFGIFICYHGENCNTKSTFILNVLAIIFLIVQGHFIFRNWKISKTRSHFLAKFGTMHLIGANLWTWIRFVLVEEAVMYKEVCESFDKSPPSSHHERLQLNNSDVIDEEVKCEGGIKSLLDGITGVMYTGLVEYSLIGVAVMYIVWRNIKNEEEKNNHPKHKETRIKVNFKHTLYGSIFGIIFIVGSLASMVLYFVYSEHISQYIFGITNSIQYILTSFTCIMALYQMRILSYINVPGNEKDEQEESQELLDMILLIVGMIGEMMYSCAGLAGLLKSTSIWNELTKIILMTHIFRIIQVTLQFMLIYISRKLKLETQIQFKNQPGKQAITFLLISNVFMFIMNIFEAEKFGVNENVVIFFGQKSWVYIVRSFSPLTIFYRFHSSVCLAEIWRNTYAEKIENRIKKFYF